MLYGSITNLDTKVFTKIFKNSASELGTIICNDSIRNPKPVHNVDKEISGFVSSNCDNGFSFDPFRELINSHKKVSKSSSSPFERTNQVEPPDHERPGKRNNLQLLSRQMNLSSKKLTTFTRSHNFLGIGHGCVLEETLSVSLANDCSSCCVIFTNTRMNVLQQLPAFF